MHPYPWIGNGGEDAETLSWAWEEGSQQPAGNILLQAKKGSEGCICPGLAIPQGGPYERPGREGSSGYQ